MPTPFPIPGRRRRKWISYCYYGCEYDQIVKVVMRCPIINGIVLIKLAWQHKIIQADPTKS
jgi:hypothetical protein